LTNDYLYGIFGDEQTEGLPAENADDPAAGITAALPDASPCVRRRLTLMRLRRCFQ